MIERFQYTQDVSAEEPIMFIDTHIGFDEQDGMGISGSDFMKELFELDNMGKKRICVHINSGGGSVTEGMAIFHAILNTKTPVDTYCVGIAASIAGVIFQAGKNRKIADYGTLMYHNVYNPKQESPSASKALDAMQQAIIIMVASRSGISENQIEEMMAKTTFLGADEAEKMGMCDEVVPSGRMNKKRSYHMPFKM
jgi:ATP-dependent Clp endopeptidase proteolytic subunit ClpP